MPPTRRSRRLSRSLPFQLDDCLWEDHSHLLPCVHEESDVDAVATPTKKNAASTSDYSDDDDVYIEPKPSKRRPCHSRSSSSTKPNPKSSHVSRPPNAFILFRSWFCDTEKAKPEAERETHHRELSRRAGIAWGVLPPDERLIWRARAHKEKIKHEQEHPGYQYSPATQNRSSKSQKKKPSRASAKRARPANVPIPSPVSCPTPIAVPSPSSPTPDSLSPMPSTCIGWEHKDEKTAEVASPDQWCAPTPQFDTPIQIRKNQGLNDFMPLFLPTEDIPPLELNDSKSSTLAPNNSTWNWDTFIDFAPDPTAPVLPSEYLSQSKAPFRVPSEVEQSSTDGTSSGSTAIKDDFDQQMSFQNASLEAYLYEKALFQAHTGFLFEGTELDKSILT